MVDFLIQSDHQSYAASLADCFGELVTRVCADDDLCVGDLQSFAREKLAVMSDATPAGPGPEALSDTNVAKIRYPTNQSQMAVAKIWEELLGIQHIGIDQDFLSLGGRSIVAVRMVALIEERLGKRISIADVIENPTIENIAAKLEDSESPRWRALIPIKSSGTKPPVFCIHAGGGHALFFRSIGEFLDEHRPLMALQPVGLDGECKPMRSFSEMASLFVDEILTVQSKSPLHLVGHCIGGRLLFAIAAELLARGHQVASLIVLDTYPPTRPVGNTEPLTPKRGLVVQLKNLASGRFRKAGLSLLRFGSSRLRKFIVPRFGSSLAKKMLVLDQVQRACFDADSKYVADVFDGKIHVIRAEDTLNIQLNFDAVCTAWEEVVLPIAHQKMFFEPDVKVLTRKIVEIVTKAEAASFPLLPQQSPEAVQGLENAHSTEAGEITK